MSDRYDLKERLGEGGFGETFVAIDRDSGAEVVVKKLHLKRADDWKGIELFEREAEVLETLDHPRIPKYLDYFEEEEGDGMRLCLVQERAPGISLEDKVASGWRCDDPEKMLRELLGILIYLQSLRPPIVHRDIKPSNIVVAEDGSISLVDFGAVANALTDSIGGSTMIGTLGYMAPEQQIGRVEMNTDLFGAATSIVFAATGDSPETMPRKKLKVDVAATGIDSKLVHCLDAMLQPATEDRVKDAATALSFLNETPKPKTKSREPTQQTKERFKPLSPSTRDGASKRNVPLDDFIGALQSRDVRPFSVADSETMEAYSLSEQRGLVLYDVMTVGLIVGLFFGEVSSIACGMILFSLTIMTWFSSAAKQYAKWQQNSALGVDTDVMENRIVTMEDSKMVIAAPAYPYPISWAKWTPALAFVMIVLVGIALTLALGQNNGIAFWSQVAPLVTLFTYLFMKIMHYFTTHRDDYRVEIDAHGVHMWDTTIPIEDVALRVEEKVVKKVENEPRREVRYTLVAHSTQPSSRSGGRSDEIEMMKLGSSFAAIDVRVLRAIDRFIKAHGEVTFDHTDDDVEETVLADEESKETATSAESATQGDRR